MLTANLQRSAELASIAYMNVIYGYLLKILDAVVYKHVHGITKCTMSGRR